MKLCIRAHDLGCKGTEEILQRLHALGIDGVHDATLVACQTEAGS